MANGYHGDQRLLQAFTPPQNILGFSLNLGKSIGWNLALEQHLSHVLETVPENSCYLELGVKIFTESRMPDRAENSAQWVLGSR